MRNLCARLTLALALCAPAAAAAQTPAAVTLQAKDGVALKASYYSPGAPGPGILLLHMCNSDRSAWASFAKAAAGRGFHVLTLDFRGYGESGGKQYGSMAEAGAVVRDKWPGDVDAAFDWLQAQPGVDRERIGAAGASCGVTQSALLAARHPEVKTLALLSGGITPEGRDHLRRTPSLSVLAAASHDDGDAVAEMRWILGWSRNLDNTFLEYKAAGHGTDMFAVEKGLEPKLLAWFDTQLRTPSGNGAAAGTTAPADLKPSRVEEFWAALTDPEGEARARKCSTRRAVPRRRSCSSRRAKPIGTATSSFRAAARSTRSGCSS